MCGIYGTTIPYSTEIVKAKLERTNFRGPDQLGIESFQTNSGQITFGHNRLSIIDLDPRSNQPFTYQNQVHLVFNGEIYNFKNLKQQLETKGYKFSTTSDTEVVCASYLEYGVDCVKHFNGMFAFVIYDKTNQRLFGARDRMGQKPFYYYHNGLDFEFSSQISSIQVNHSNLSISSKAIDYYLTWGNIPDPFSIFNEISKLKAGYIFTFDLSNGNFQTSQYWDIDYKGSNKFEGTLEAAKTELDNILTDAVKTRLFADVPVGVFLSGGVDSSIIAALAQKTSDTKIKTFSVKFNEKGFDESPYAQQVADHLKTDHHVIECNYNEGIDLIHDFSHYYDEPFSDSSAIPTMLLSKHTRKHVKVALSGDSGDENFIGYQRYDWFAKGNRIMKIPLPIRMLASYILKVSPNYRHKIIADFLKLNNINEAYLRGMTGSEDVHANKAERDVDELKYLMHSDKNLFERISDFDLKAYLNWDINTKVDRASMAFSLEARAPLEDHRVVEFARSLPTEYKYHNGTLKLILKELLYDYVPKEIFDRQKSGFTMPFAHWFKHDLKDYVLDELNEESLNNIPNINVSEVKNRITKHMSGERNHYSSIWNILVLKQWLIRNGEGYSIK